ncbi:MAG: hypothetical protein B6D46_12090 [Polyangiaceae bacterium UTPRO1]|nr:GDSL-type esterase/lipase family protein [Myxococcales bacterium]OQY65964.1 MAG: hypothetical protein B6D46_12090 [Polyangiaceae bacterium UTPRO1]
MSAGRRLAGPALAVVAIAATLGTIELAARVSLPAALPRVAMYRPATGGVGYELIPGWRGTGPLGEGIRINAAGLRGAEVGDRTARAHRAVVIGDSFTFGLGVAEADAWPAVLARAWGEECIEVLNAGVPGYDLVQEARALARRVRELAPDLVIVGFLENDLYNPDGGDFVATEEGTLAPRPEAVEAARSLNPFIALPGLAVQLQLHSAAFRAASYWAIRRRLAVHGDADLARLAREVAAGTDLPTRLLRGEDDAATATRWAAAERELRAMADVARGAGARPVLVLLPRPEQLYASSLRGGFVRIRAMATESGIQVVDATPSFAAAESRVGLYLFPADHHPSARGHAAIAAAVAGAVLPEGCRRQRASSEADVSAGAGWRPSGSTVPQRPPAAAGDREGGAAAADARSGGSQSTALVRRRLWRSERSASRASGERALRSVVDPTEDAG